jgi:hypothetical protein
VKIADPTVPFSMKLSNSLFTHRDFVAVSTMGFCSTIWLRSTTWIHLVHVSLNYLPRKNSHF